MATVAEHTVRPRRAAELGLLAVAVLLGAGAYAIIGLNVTGEIPANTRNYSLGLAALALGAHLVLRWRAPYADPVILPVTVALNGIGLAMIFRLDLATRNNDIPDTFASRQLAWTTFGVVLASLVLIALRDHRTLRRFTYTAMVVALGFVVLPLVPGLGRTINGARIWIHLGSQSLQPAEFAKIALAVFFAGYLVTNRETLALAGPRALGLQLPRWRDLGPILAVWVFSLAILVLQRDLGTSLLFFGLFVAMLYLATERISWIVIGLVLFLGGASLAAASFAHVGARFHAWLHAFDQDVFEAAFGGSGQLVRGLFGMASGGLFGTGWGEGRPQLVPYAESDFIIASLGEELGLTGLLAILVLYLVLVQRGLRTAIGVRDGFGKLLAGGLAFTIAWQCFVVVGGVTRLIPLTGLAMPFLAYGGSALLANWVIVALLLRISDSARRPAPTASSPLVLGPEPIATTPADTAADDGEAWADDEALADDGDLEPDDQPTQIVRPGGERP
ncbi:MAG: FtsW/RodA/SpoVE family cell cycle protein [Actinomycetales bacterium]|nr:FtsW/RodA/SpoVE family cell cycle protein [Actinomycetales bacterium]